MSTRNGQAEMPVNDQAKEATERDLSPAELPVADATDGFEESSIEQGTEVSAGQASGPRVADSEVEKLRGERDALLDRLARQQAEFDNYRKRAAKENADFRDYAVTDAARAILPVIDSFGLAIKNADAHPEDFRKGVELIYKQMQDLLQKLNVQRVPAQGEPFDPRVHEAIEMVESNDVPDHHVLEELQPGYRIKDRLLRPAMVRVAKNKQV